MSTTHRLVSSTCFVLLALASSTGCVVRERAAIVEPATTETTSGEVVEAAPPADVDENPGPAPGTDVFWIRGHHVWRGGVYVWVGGHWEHHRPGFVWEHGYWGRRGRGHVWVEGRWHRR